MHGKIVLELLLSNSYNMFSKIIFKIRSWKDAIISSYKQFALAYPKLDSAIHTFLAVFALTIGEQLRALPFDRLVDVHTYTTAFVAGIIGAGFRSALRSLTTK